MFTGEIQRSRSKRPFVIAAVFVVLVVGLVLIVPMPHAVESTFVLAPITTIELTAPRDGTIAEVTSTTGAVVAKGSTIAKYDVTEAEKKVAELEKQLAELDKVAPTKPNPKAKAAVLKAELALKAAQAAVEKAPAAKKAPLEKKQQAAASALEKAQAAIGLTAEERETQLTAAKEALREARGLVASGTILAPASGVLTVVGLERGRAVTTGAKLAVVEDISKLRAMVKVPAGEPVTKGMGVELELPKGKKRVLFDADAKGDVAEAEFDNASGELSVGVHGEAHIEGAQRSIVSH
jgi:multidrug efflux pump subunit AcrA (membrane-fusion protein)